MTARAWRPSLPAGALIATAVIVVALPGCGGSLTRKAGRGARGHGHVVLVMSTGDGLSAQSAFAAAVKRLSHETLSIKIRDDSGGTRGVSQHDAEHTILDRVERGDVAVAWLPTRVWDSGPVVSFEALEAPFLITNSALLWKVVTSGLADQMLRGTEARGLVGLAIVPIALRRILGRVRPLVSLPALRRARIATFSPLDAQVVDALGAVPRLDLVQPDVRLREGVVDGVETGGPFLARYALVARFIPANVVVSARADVIAVNKRVFDGLTEAQRSALRVAARRTVQSQRDMGTREAEALEAACATGAKLAAANPGQLAQLVQAERRVYRELASDPEIGQDIEQIQAMKPGTADPAVHIPASCAA
jgi:TRAP-type C4-dicarboxylate transport system substrate-binding protein